MAYPISDVPRRIVYSGSAGVGPYAFTFEVLAATDIAVYKNGTLLTLTTDYTVSINTGTGTGTITLMVAATGSDQITLVGDRAIERTSDFVTGGDLFANTLNTELDSLTIFAQQVDEKADRAIKAPVTDPTTINMTLPAQATRANKALGFGSNGNPASSINTLAAIDAAVTTVQTLAGAAPGSSAGISHIAAGTGAVATTVQAKLRETVSVKDFGAVGDGIVDDTAAIQAAIDYATYVLKVNRVYLPSGQYKTSDTIHLGYGIGYNSVTFEGDGCGYRGESQFAASVIRPTFRDRPAIAVQGARNTRISRIAIIGLDVAYLNANPLSTTDIRTYSNWVNPASASSQFAVYCGIAVDPYSGSAPSPKYPDVTYPSIVGGGAVPQYNKDYSSDVLISDCFIAGFVVGLAVQPCNADGNGDFVRVDHTVFERLAAGVTVGNTQSRLVRFSYCQFTRLHTAVSNRLYGRGPTIGQAGAFNSHLDSCEFRSITQIIDCNPALMGPMVFTSCYAESLWRIGSVRQGVARSHSIQFNGCQLQFSWQSTAERFGIPDYILDTDASEHVVEFNTCSFINYYSTLAFRGSGKVVLNNCNTWLPNPDAICSSPIAAKCALNFTLGGIVGAREATCKTDTRWSLATGNAVGGTAQIMRGGHETSATRDLCLSLYAVSAGPTSGSFFGDRFFVRDPGVNWAIDLSGATVTLSGRTLTVTRSNLTAFNTLMRGGRKGDLLWEPSSASVFFVTGYSGTTVTAELMNNFYIDGGGTVQYLVPIPTTSGNYRLFNSRMYACGAEAAGAVATSGSRVVTAATRDDGASITGSLAEGDVMFASEATDRTFVSDPTISTRTATTGSITSGTNALTVAVNTIQNGWGITVAGAGAAGATLVTTVASGGGTTNLVLATNASTTVSGAVVEAGGLVGNGIIVVGAAATRSRTLKLQQFIRQPVP